jgi:Mrp family chromosome partitioning ATPase
VLATVAGACILGVPAASSAYGAKRAYVATTVVSVSPDPVGNGESPSLGADQQDRFVQGEVARLGGASVRSAVVDAMRPLRVGSISAVQIGTTDLVEVSATASSPESAVEAANAAAAGYRTQRRDGWNQVYQKRREALQQQRDLTISQLEALNGEPLTDPVTIAQQASLQAELTRVLTDEGTLATAQPDSVELTTVVEPAKLGGVSTTSSPVRKAAIAILFGGILGLGAALLASGLRRRIVDLKDLGVFALPVLMSLPKPHGDWRREILNGSTKSRQRVASNVSRLDLSRFDLSISTRRSAVALVSATGGPGTSFAALNLAVAAAELGPSLLVCAADVAEGPEQAVSLLDRYTPGIADLWEASPQLIEDVSAMIIPTSVPGLSVLPPGTPTNRSEQALQRMIGCGLPEVVSFISPRAVIDLPPLDRSAAGFELARARTSIAIVVTLGVSRVDDVGDAVQELQRRGAELIGIVAIRNRQPRMLHTTRRSNGMPK